MPAVTKSPVSKRMLLAGGCGDTNGKPKIGETSHLEEAYDFGKNKIGYKDCGSLVMDIPGYAQPVEMFMVKAIACNRSAI